jgi:large subunit ribosomal protein L20
MSRVKRGNVRTKKRKRLLLHAKGFRWRRSNVYRLAKEAVHHSWMDSYIGRKQKKREFRALWNIQINAACRENDFSYSKFIHALKQKNIALDRKILAELARNHPEAFKFLADHIKSPK